MKLKKLSYKPGNAHTSIESHTIRHVLSEVLVLLFNEDKNPIEKAMRLLLNFFNADWGYVAIFEEDYLTANFPCEVMSEYMEVPKNNETQLTYETIPWIIDTIRTGKDIVLCNIKDLPEEAHIDKALLLEQQLKSMLIIPLTFHHEVRGFIGFDSIRIQRNWTRTEVSDMHLVANIFSILIERWLNENKMEKSRKLFSELSTKFQLFFNNLPVGVELYDADGILIDINEEDEKIFGATHEQLIGINLFDNPLIPDSIMQEINEKESFVFPLTYNFKDIHDSGYYPSTLINCKKHLQVKGFKLNDEQYGPMGYLFLIADNTEKQIQDEQTQNNLTILKAALLAGDSIVGEYDIEQKSFYIDPTLNDHPCNNNLFRFLKENSPLPIEQLKSIQTLQSNGSGLSEVIAGKLENCTFINKAAINGEIFWIRINAQAYKTKGNTIPNKIICHLTNITEEKLLEEKLIKAEYESKKSEIEIQKIREADKLKSAFLANMSHEIRTPLNAIIGFSNIIVEESSNKEAEEYADIINKNSDLLLRLITDILDFSKIEAGVLDYSFGKLYLRKTCHEQYKIHSLKTQKNVTLIYDMDNLPDIILQTDPKRVTQVISNLISNAIKFTNEGTITLSYEVQENAVIIKIADTGIGIAPENINTIFDRFVKLNHFKQGTGLGLSICKTIVETLGGRIGVTSQLGKGSTFWFSLPL